MDEDGLGSRAIEHDSFETVNKGHGRVERRRLGDVRSVGHRTRERPWRVGEHERRGDDRVHKMGERRDDRSPTALHIQPAGSSGPDSERREGALGSGERFSPDAGAPFGEDGSVIGVGRAAENMSTLRRLALNPVKGEKSLKIGVAAKRKRAGWDLDCLRTILRLAQ